MTESTPVGNSASDTARDTTTVDVSENYRQSLLSARGVAEPGMLDDADLLHHGLTDHQVQTRTTSGLVNVQPEDSSRSLATILRTHLLTLFNLVIFLCAVGIILMGRWLDLLFAIAGVSNVVIGVVQEYSAKLKLDRIALLHQDGIMVRRNGANIEINIEEAVLDDVVYLRAGDQVPADGLILASESLDIDESLITGEADPVYRHIGSTVLSGTSVVTGNGYFRITGVGHDSHAARLTRRARKFTKAHSELRSGLDKVASWITIALVPLIAVVAWGQIKALGGWQQVVDDGSFNTALIATIAGITTMIPQGLALMTTISFAVAALTLGSKKVLIQEQPAVEILARVDTVCLDKTGTLTEGVMQFSSAKALAATDHGWKLVLGHIGADPNANTTAVALREPFPQSPPLPQTDAIAFASERRWSAFAFGNIQDTQASAGAWVLGAPEALIDALSVDTDARAELHESAKRLSSSGKRTMLLAHSTTPSRSASTTHPWFGEHAVLPGDLYPAAVVTFEEKVRDDARETLEYFQQQGVELKVISGDSPHTVAAVARQIGWEHPDSGYDACNLPDNIEDMAAVMQEHSVFGRVSPDQKEQMVKALQHRERVVAMTGDGVNDALAVKTADLGIAMGDAAAATKAVSRLVLLDSKFSRLPSVLAEGRKVIANMERLAHLFLAKTAYAFLFVLLFSLLAWQYPALPRQMSTADFLFIGLASFILALMPNPRRYVAGFLSRALKFALPTGVMLVAALWGINWYARVWAGDFSGVLPYASEDPGAPLVMEQLQTATFITLTLAGLWLLNVISRPLNWQKIGMLIALHIIFILVLVVPLSQWYHHFILPPTPIIIAAVGIAALGALGIEVIHRIHDARMGLAPDDPRPKG
ncbi:MAG: HAD-IC family P-type ATPase [Yaniella sp.]|uniref:HAD-IC family P-type ATPase n=1 Tax=Yaniella sp. TaxID=2773929 RepID=UPI00264879EF|nr:HAD-IC family P-type ATPase [Yaniella sp.]MDN5731457.1 HAD-IC family P-type ATPase [Yaniella sp.]MDN5817882.1 HAD-IC family P-type ATPase [Yaniella sp.]MDN5888919.1 HAD-IC family P-type ATPase [Yaniella sp.]MDN6148311.1 HAD-IC family P-type ATPase [Yaniella sp.]MDN6150195.1 HAD-IC family P-type ATPase [Yaniella sp.]